MDPQPSEVRSICALDENNEATVVASLTDEETEDGKNYVIELHLLQ
jgi:ABC-type phosphate/phosphonate transport system ATPase subunit